MWGIERKKLRKYDGDLTDNASAGMNRRRHTSATNDVGEDHTNDVPEIKLEQGDGARANYDPEEQRDEGQRERVICRGGGGGGGGRNGRRPGGEEDRSGTHTVKQNMWTGGVYGTQSEFSNSECMDKGVMHTHQAAEASDDINIGIMDSRGRGKQSTEGQDVYITQLLELQNKDSRTIVTTLSADSRFASILNKITACSPTVYVVARVLAKSCEATSVPGDVAKVLLAVAESRFYSHVTATLQNTMQNPHGNEENTSQFIRDLLILLIELSNRLPHSYMSVDVLGLESSLKMAIDQLDQVGNIVDEDMHLKMTELLDIKPRMVDNTRSSQEGSEENPPNDFREIPIFPTDDDIYPNGRQFLRKNIDVGKYRDVDHYLDVQFRLMREDYISPLRDGIAEYLQSQRTNQKVKDITVYHDVHVIRTVCLEGGVLHRVKFDVSTLTREDWENSKRLNHSSLVCLSPDNFVTLLFATVSNRDSRMLRNGIIDLLFENYDVTTDILAKASDFEMVESPTFFEAYRHVLQALQTVRSDTFPFEKYIVHCNRDVDPPKYLRLDHGALYDLRPLVDDIVLIDDVNHPKRKASYNWTKESACAKEVEVCDYSQWPSAEQLKLDTSQYKAVQTALTKEFTIIQGPPGTGKTFIGLTIVKALLHNAHMWSDVKKSSPILIVCYTNHALDQFLEGVVSFFEGDVLRVGGRMKSDCKALEKCSMLKHKIARNDKVSRGGTAYHSKVALVELRLKIETMWLQIEDAKCYILHEDILRPIMEYHYDCMVAARKTYRENLKKPTSVMVKWLQIYKKKPKMYSDIKESYYMYYTVDGMRGRREQLERLQRANNKYDVLNLNREPGKELKDAEQRQNLDQMMPVKEANKVRNLWNLKTKDRWRLYRYWVSCFTVGLREQIRTKEGLYMAKTADYKALQLAEEKQIMMNARVIGMTTTCAAKYKQTLSEVGPKIVIVEEAAEVLEGHTVTSLSQKCEQLILIGDHKQLKPNPAVYRLAKKFNLDLSLFERMVNNGIPCDTLTLQHRMRPEISNLMKRIYPDLQDHPSVFDYESMKGVSSNVFFVSHGHLEGSDGDMRSHSNTFEAQYVVAMCVYFVKQGYAPSQITMLTTYSGQLRKLKQLMPKSLMTNEKFEGVTVKVVDNYQGEENDIILLSLVRSNAEGKVGFLKIENRICVALSRAKKGLFVIGNFNLLAKESLLWKELVRDLGRNKMIGTSLSLYCQNHPQDDRIDAKSVDDFKKAPEGGCMKKCLFRLDCGHACRLRCHPKDPQHTEYKCEKACPKTCNHGHPCPLLCHQGCGDCLILVEKTLPKCGHKQTLYCFTDPQEFNCKFECEKTLKCGHKQTLYCFIDPQEFNCMFDCEKTLKCGHKQILPCYQDPMEYMCMLECEEVLECGHICGKSCGQEHECTKLVMKTWRCGHSLDVPCMKRNNATCNVSCSQVLQCGHTCQGTCHDCHGGRLHVSCNMHYLTETLVCGHTSETRRSPCTPCEDNCENSCIHGQCLNTCGIACLPCTKPCPWKCLHHACTKKCHEPCDRPPCDRPCMERIRCGHRCIGMCGERCPSLCRFCDWKEVTTIRFGDEDQPDARFVELDDCGHIVEVAAMDKHMSTRSDNGEIGLKACPICKTQIRRNVRYGFQIKEVLDDIERVKKIHMVRFQSMTTLKAELEKETRTVIKCDGTPGRPDTDLECNPVAIVNQLKFLKSASTVYAALKQLGAGISAPDVRYVYHDGILNIEDRNTFMSWLNVYRLSFSEQEVGDAQNELLRRKAIVQLLRMKKVMKRRMMKLNAKLLPEFDQLKDILKVGKPYTAERQGTASAIFQKLRKKLPLSGIGALDEERIQTVKETTIQAGHWFKCPEGHIYELGDRSRTDESCTFCRGITCSDEGNTYSHARGIETEGDTRAGHMDIGVRGRDTKKEGHTRVSGQNTDSHVHLRDTNTNTRGRDTLTRRWGTDSHMRRRTGYMDTHATEKDRRMNARSRGTDPHPTASKMDRRDMDTHSGGKNKRRNSTGSGTDTHMKGTDIGTDVKGSAGTTDTHARGKDTQTNWRGRGTDLHPRARTIDTDARGSTSNTDTHARGKAMRANDTQGGIETHVRRQALNTNPKRFTSNTTHAKGKAMQTHGRGSGTDTQVRGSDIATTPRDSTRNTDTRARGMETQTHDRKGCTDPRVRGKDVDTHLKGSAGIMETRATGKDAQANGKGSVTDTHVKDSAIDMRGSASKTGTHARGKSTWRDEWGWGTHTYARAKHMETGVRGSNTDTDTLVRRREVETYGRGSTANTDTHARGKDTQTNWRGRGTDLHPRARTIDTDARGTTANTDTHARGKDTQTNWRGRGTDLHPRARTIDTDARGSTNNMDTHARGNDIQIDDTQAKATWRGTDPHPRTRNMDTDFRGSNKDTHPGGKNTQRNSRWNDIDTCGRGRATDTDAKWRTANTDTHARGKDTQTNWRGRGTDLHPRARNIDTDARGSTSNTDTHARGNDIQIDGRRRGTYTRVRGRDIDTDVRGSDMNTQSGG